MQEPPRLVVNPPAKRFGPGDADALVKALDDLARYTHVTEVSDEGELAVSDDGALRDGFRMTATALRQVCNLLSNGLYAMLVDLAGVHSAASGECSVAAAARVYNMMLRRRSSRVVGRIRLLRHLGERRVDGVLGVRFHLAPNDEFYANAASAASSAARPATFSGASLAGRRLSLTFSHRRPLAKGPDGEAFHDGLFFTNSEVGGESSLRAAPILVRGSTGAFSMGRHLGGRQAHVGAAFRRKVDRIFAAASAVSQSGELASSRFAALAATSLGLGYGRDEDVQERIDAIASKLHESGVPKAAGAEAVAVAMRIAPSRSWASRGDEAAGRTAYDLYNGLTAVALGRYVTTQECLAQAAHELFKGKIKI